MSKDMIAGIRKDRLANFAKREAVAYAKARPKSAKALSTGAGNFLNGVPMHWMADWPMPHLPLVAKAQGSRIEDIDGIGLDDFCLGDTGSMFGHSPAPVAKAIRQQARRGLTYMLPTEAALEAGRLLTERFGNFRWQIATTALPFGLPAKSPGGPRFWSSTAAITARSMTPLSCWKTARPSPHPA